MKKWQILALMLPSLAFANPQKVVEDIFSKAGQSEISSSQEKQKEVSAMVDFSALAKSALGKDAKGVAPKELEWFQQTLQEIITRTVYPKAPDFLKGVQIAYDKVEEKKNFAFVKSTVQNKADLTEVEYKLAKTKDNWRVVDVSISGLSWVESIHDQVKDVLKKKKWKGLKEAMNKRLNELKSGAM